MFAFVPSPVGELLTRLSIWLALIAYAIGTALLLEPHGQARHRAQARWVWTLGCLFFLSHVVCAFDFYHHWSHDAAWRETARQTAQLTGWHWGGGLYFNYVVAAGWLADVLWWWTAPGSFDQRPRWVTGLWHGFLFFMVFNGAIVFGHGPVRLLGLLICAVLAIQLWGRTKILKLKS